MKRNILLICFLLVVSPLFGKTLRSTQFEKGGEGPYKAIAVEDDLLEGYLIFRPENLSEAFAAEGKLPVILFGNGSCSRDSWLFKGFLTHLASHGYVILTRSVFLEEGPDMMQFAGEAESATGVPPALAERMQKYASPDGGKDALDLHDALNVLEAMNRMPGGEYYQMLDTEKVTAMGQSCGGLQALLITSSGDPRIVTIVALNTGIFPSREGMPAYIVGKEALENIRIPIIYIIGGETDIAYPQASSDYEALTAVPAAFANLPVGHAGTFIYPHGGEFGDVALLWLTAQVKKDSEALALFKEGKLPAGLSPDWRLVSKNW